MSKSVKVSIEFLNRQEERIAQLQAQLKRSRKRVRDLRDDLTVSEHALSISEHISDTWRSIVTR